jgi:transcriptional regulatory protein LevR
VKKGAYTGADTERMGLLEKANGGILFLDEVHRLPAEGQEMFFTFMDKGTFRRLGETDSEREAKVLIISATTENPESSLLKTFTRRIPMIIRIPGLNERGIEERFGLITNFFREECFRLDREIMVSVNSMRAFLSYNCTNNVGQLKTDIQLACAKAYADFLSHKKNGIKINSTDLPAYIREGLYKETEHRQIWNNLIGINNRYCLFNKNQDKLILDNQRDEESIYEIIDLRVNELKLRGISDRELELEMERDIEEYFTQYIHSVNNRVSVSNIANVVDPLVINIVEEIIRYSEARMNRIFSQRVYLGMAVHIEAAIERIKRGKKIINPQLNKIRVDYNSEFNTALDCLKIIEGALDISMPIDEAGFLTMFFVLDDEEYKSRQNNAGVLVIAHGESTATSMAEVANALLGTRCAEGINAPLSESPQQVLIRVKEHIKKEKRRSGYVFLVDMGSLSTFGEIIEKEMDIPVRVVQLVSTLHVIEAARKAELGYNVDDIFADVSNIVQFIENKQEYSNEKQYHRKAAIVTVCMTGEGGAIALKNFIQSHLKFDKNIFEIIPINLIGKEDIKIRIEKISLEKEVLCVITPFHIDTNAPQFSLNDVLNLKAISRMQHIIDVEATYLKMGETLRHQLKNVDGELVYQDIKLCVSNIQTQLLMKLDTDMLIGVVFHIGCMIDRLKENIKPAAFEGRDEYISGNLKLYEIINYSMQMLNKKYGIDITKDEICYIMNFFDTRNFENNSCSY